jgi:uncharacterized OsmC-like protein
MSNAHTPVVVTHEEKVKFAVQIGNHRITTDQPRSNGGDDAGPGPLDFLSASLGACVAFYVVQFCAARDIPHDGLRVEVRYHKVLGPSRVGGFDVRVQLPPEVPEPVRLLIDRAARSCPAHNTFAHGAEVAIEVEALDVEHRKAS